MTTHETSSPVAAVAIEVMTRFAAVDEEACLARKHAHVVGRRRLWTDLVLMVPLVLLGGVAAGMVLLGESTEDRFRRYAALLDGPDAPAPDDPWRLRVHEKLARLQPGNRRLAHARALALTAAGRGAEGRALMESLANQNGRVHAPALVWLVSRALEREDLPDPEVSGLLDRVEAGLRLLPEHTGLRRLAARISMRLRAYPRALEHMRRVPGGEPARSLRLAQLARLAGAPGDHARFAEQARRIARENLDADILDRPDRLIAIEALVLLGKPGDALTLVDEGRSLHPGDAGLERVRSRLLTALALEGLPPSRPLESADLERRLDLLLEATRGPGTPLAAYRALTALVDQSVVEETTTRRVLEAALREGRETARIHELLAELAHRSGATDRALRHWQLAVAADPRSFRSLNNLAWVEAFERGGDLEACLDRVDRALAIRPDHPDLHDTRGRLLEALGRLPEAAASLEKALPRHGADPDFRQTLAGIYEDLGLPDLAEGLEAGSDPGP